MDAELLIVGAGPAGTATASFLAALAPALAARTLVVDQDEFPRDKVCAGAIGQRAEARLAAIGVAPEVPGVPVRALAVRAGGRELRVREDAVIGRVVRRCDFDTALLEAARARGVAVRTGVRVTGLRRRPGSIEVATSAGALSARVVVGADGVGSAVRRALGLPKGRFRAQAVEVDTPDDGSLAPDELRFDLSDRRIAGYAWDFPTLVAGRRMIGRGLYRLGREAAGGVGAAAGGDGSWPDLAALLRERLQALGVATGGLAVRRFAERGLCPSEPCARPGVLLVGEAAGIDPVLGEGIAQAVLYGEVAARYLAPRILGGDTDFADWPAALARTRLGLDLRVRARALGVVYGVRTRPFVERWLTRSHALARAGARYFAGRPVPRTWLARAVLDAGAAALLR
ncbi:MAG: FAD-dependent oxidoreductase [Myxococcales bacterium]|nr:FAD-dependent oxidoreductase [Myxococcales bacterium]